MTREELASLSDEQIEVLVALDILGYITTKRQTDDGEETVWHTPWQPMGCWPAPARYARRFSLAWEVVEQIKAASYAAEPVAAAQKAAASRLLTWWEGAKVWAIVEAQEAEAARQICIEALLAWHASPLFPEEESRQ